LAAFVWLYVSVFRARLKSSALASRAVALLVVTVCLFPLISASDDIALLSYAEAQNDAASGLHWNARAKHSGSDNLATLVSLLEVLEASQSAITIVLGLSLCLFAMAATIFPRSLDGLFVACAGRAPPIRTISF
jgi:hypothetical protein